MRYQWNWKKSVIWMSVICLISGWCIKVHAVNDPLAPQQWWLDDMNLEAAWSQNYTNDTVVVAVIDTGVFADHEDLKDQIWVNAGEIPGNGIDDDENGYVDDVNGWDFYNDDSTICSASIDSTGKILPDANDLDDHGTHVAGIIAAKTNNGVGIAGVAGAVNVKIMTLKTFGGPNAEARVDALVDAVKYAEQMGAKIVNLSWELTGNLKKLQQAMKESNMLFVCAAGNSGNDIDKNPVYPGSYQSDNIINVTSIDSYGEFCGGFANYGKKSVLLAAPGKSILSTGIGDYFSQKGTSMSAPMVTGTAVLCAAANPLLDATELKRVVQSSVKINENLKKRTITGGSVDSAASVIKALETRHMNDTTAPSIQLKVDKKKKSVTCKINVKDVMEDGTVGSGVRMVRYAKGKKKISYFKNGLVGKVIYSGNRLKFKKKTTITVYAQDRNGNATVKTVVCKLKKNARKR